jgi:GH35 family endo-1,4-beta-xylanase
MISKTDDNDPYFRNDPGTGLKRVVVHEFDVEKGIHSWKPWRTNDGRILPNNKSNFTKIENPFGLGYLVLLNTYFDPSLTGRSFGGFGMRAPVVPAVNVNNQSFVEFDFYYAKSAANKYMRFEIWSTSSGGEGSQVNAGFPGLNRTAIYIRTIDLEGVFDFNLDFRCGYFNDETWYKKAVRAAVPVSSGKWDFLNIDIHTEMGAKVENGVVMLGNIRITQPDPSGDPIPNVVNTKHYLEVEPVKKKYNPGNGYFLIGTIETGTIPNDSIRGYHFELFVDSNNMKPERHLRPPLWLKDRYVGFAFKSDSDGPEWDMPTSYYLSVRDSGKPGEYKLHGHTLAWFDQSPAWMRQIVPENIVSMEYNSDGLFYSGGINASPPFLKTDRETARRIYFNHIVYVLRHFMTTDTRYDSDENRGVIPFHSFDVLNAEIHESRHSNIIQNRTDEWKTALRHISWLMAMTDNDYGNIQQHYIYLLFKFAHIAIPNAQMAEKYKAGYNDPYVVGEYMKKDNHDNDGSIDAFVNKNPPILVYNDYDLSVFSKAKVAYNMIREINTAWKSDPLYDGRNLIECIGIQGHETVSRDLAGKSRQTMAMFANLIDEGLLDCICYSEMDMKQKDFSPGGGAIAPEVLNQKQADSIGYQYALFFKLFEKYKKYIDHVIFWGQSGASWLNGYLLFDHEEKASQAYYGIMDPDRFIKGHSYLDEYFAGEYEKVRN